MQSFLDKKEKVNTSVSRNTAQLQSDGISSFADNRPEANHQARLSKMANDSPQALQLKAMNEMANNGDQAKQAMQLKDLANGKSTESKATTETHSMPNKTGLPDQLKSGMENLSGVSLDDVKVHRNSNKPAQLQAKAYAQGSDIHLGAGQEKHLAHEAWHVVQQKQGRVQPTVQKKGAVSINDDETLEREADIMGEKAIQVPFEDNSEKPKPKSASQTIVQKKSNQSTNTPPIRSIEALGIQSGSTVSQFKWIDDDGPEMKWDQVIDGVQWYYIKSSGKMYYQVISVDAIKLGDEESYRSNEGQEEDFTFWEKNRATEINLSEFMNPEIIGPEEQVEQEQTPKTGMEALDKSKYLASAKVLENEWIGKPSEDRAKDIICAVNVSLAQIGVPPVGLNVVVQDADSKGALKESTWCIELNSLYFDSETIDGLKMAEIANTVFHEARHAEQYFRIARMLAAFGLDKTQIQEKMTMGTSVISGTMVDFAIGSPMQINDDSLSTEFMETIHWFESLYGKKSSLRVETIKEMKNSKLEFHSNQSEFQILKTNMAEKKEERFTLREIRDINKKGIQAEYFELKAKLDSLDNEDTEERAEISAQIEDAKRRFGHEDQLFQKQDKELMQIQLAIQAEQKERITMSNSLMENVNEGIESYKALPEEEDAFRVGDEIEELYLNLK